ncbi:MAG: T9SS type A sorting domain-containing protein [Bacteroidia bacterium]
MTKILILSIILFSTVANCQIPSIEWAFKTGGTGTDVGLCVKHDQQNNIYAGGRFQGSIDIDPGTAVQTIVSAGDFDMYLQKLDEDQNLVWEYHTGSSGSDEIVEMEIDALGNVYFTCFYSGTVDFDPSAGVSTLTSLSISDMAVVKLDAMGSFLWVKTVANSNTAGTPCLAIDASNNAYFSFGFTGSIDANPGTGIETLTSAGENDIVIVKLNSSGDYQWSQQIGSDSFDAPQGIEINSLGNIVLVGRFRNTVDFNTGVSVNNSTSNGTNDLFVLTLDNSGNYIWHVAFGGVGFDSYYDLVIDNQDNILVTGYYSGTADLNPGVNVENFTSSGTDDLFVQKFDVNGSLIWVRAFGGSNTENSYGISTDSQGAAYIVGDFFDTIDFDPTEGVFNLTSAGNNDIFVQKLDSNGDFEWAFKVGATFSQAGYAIDVDENSNVIITGTISNSVDFDPSSASTILAAGSTFDAFLAKYSQELCVQPVLTSLDASLTTLCEGENLNLTVQGNLNGAANWKLYLGANCTGTFLESNTTGVFARSANTNETDYYVKAAGGCLIQESDCVERSVIVNPTFNINQNVVICSGEDIEMPDGSILSNVTETGMATFNFQSSSSCDSTINVFYDVNTVPMEFTLDNNLITITNLNPKEGAEVAWLDCDNNFTPIEGETSNTFLLIAPASVAFQVSTNDGCSEISECFTLLNIESLHDDVELFPNPFNEILNIRQENPITEVSIFSITGALVFQNAYNANHCIINAQPLVPGSYTIRINSKNGLRHAKLLKL